MTRLSRSQVEVVVWSVAVFAGLTVFALASAGLDPFWGYHGVLVLYWLVLCLPMALRHGGDLRHAFSLALHGPARLIVPAVLGLQCLAILIGALLPVVGQVAPAAFALAVGVALVNGPLEEAAWRGAFRRAFADRPILGFVLMLVLFTLVVHVPLALVSGVALPGGWPSLVGGAAGLGLIWGLVAWRTGSVGWVAIAHTITNVLAFPGLYVLNAWP